MVDDTVGNIKQKGDGYVCGEIHICERGTTPQHKIISKDKRYTLLELIALSKEPVMCIIYFLESERM